MVPTSIRLDESIKKEAQLFAHNAGISLNALINACLKSVIRSGRLTLIGTTENGFTPEFEESIIKADKESEIVRFDSIEEMIDRASDET